MERMDKTFTGIKPDGSFRFHIPIELKKVKGDKIEIEGIASMESPDLVGEKVIQKGMDISYFLKRGFFNDNHDKTTGGKIGIPTDAKHTGKGLFVKGYMLDTPRAKEIVELGKALAESGSERQLGFSVEGKIIKRNGKVIEKSWVKDVAITCEPMHPGTYMEIVKSISADIEENGSIDNEGDIEERMAGIVERLETIEKALCAEHDNGQGGSVLKKESLESDLKVLDMQGDTKQFKMLSEIDIVEKLIERGYPFGRSRKIAQLILNNQK
jgi:hypothetical protein